MSSSVRSASRSLADRLKKSLTGLASCPDNDGYASFFEYNADRQSEPPWSDSALGTRNTCYVDLANNESNASEAHWQDVELENQSETSSGSATHFWPLVRGGLLGVGRTIKSSCRQALTPATASRRSKSSEVIAERDFTYEDWVEAMEVNLRMLQTLIEFRRDEQSLAAKRGDGSAETAAATEIKLLKVRHARLACALWVQPSDLPSSQELLMAERRALELELSEHLREYPNPKRGSVRASDSSARGLGSQHPESRGIDEASNNDVFISSRHSDESDSSSLNAPVLSSMSVDDNSGTMMRLEEFISPLVELASISNSVASSSGAAVQDGVGRKGWSGESTPRDVHAVIEKGSGKGEKGAKGPPLLSGIGRGGRHRRVTPLGRRFHWTGLTAERIRGTVFEGDIEHIGEQFNHDAIQTLFAEDNELAKLGRPSAGQLDLNEVAIFDNSRSQNISIVLRGIFGQPPSLSDMEGIAAGVEAIDSSYAGCAASCLRDADKIGLLQTALPDAAEISALSSAPPERLRCPERLVLPLVRVPYVKERLRALHLSVLAESTHAALHSRMEAVVTCCKALRESATLRCVLQTVARLGSWINSSDPNMERGFALSSALGKLRVFRALREDRELSLLHVTVLAAAGGSPDKAKDLGRSLFTDLKSLNAITREDLQDLSQGVKEFQARASWLEAEAEQSIGVDSEGPHRHPLGVRTRLRKLFKESLEPLSRGLSVAWLSTKEELAATLVFFAEPDSFEVEQAAEQLFRTLYDFRVDFCKAASQIGAQPERFMRAYELGPRHCVAPSPHHIQQRPKARSRSLAHQKTL